MGKRKREPKKLENRTPCNNNNSARVLTILLRLSCYFTS